MAEEGKNKDKGILLKNVKGIKQLISPAGIDATYTNHLEIISNRSKYARTMAVTSLPRTTVFPEFLRDMYNFGDINVSVFINPIPVSLSQTDLNREINTLITEIIVAQDRGDVNRARSLTIKKAEREELRDEIEAGWNSLFNASIISTIFAYSHEDLDRLTDENIDLTLRDLINEYVKTFFVSPDLKKVCSMDKDGMYSVKYELEEIIPPKK